MKINNSLRIRAKIFTKMTDVVTTKNGGQVQTFGQENGAAQNSAANALNACAPNAEKKKRRRRRHSKKKLAQKEANRLARVAAAEAEAAAADSAYVPEDTVAGEDEVLDIDVFDTEAAEAAEELAGLVSDAADMGKLPDGRTRNTVTVEKTPTAAAEAAATSDLMDISLVSVDSSFVTEVPTAQRLGAEEKGEACNACALM